MNPHRKEWKFWTRSFRVARREPDCDQRSLVAEAIIQIQWLVSTRGLG